MRTTISHLVIGIILSLNLVFAQHSELELNTKLYYTGKVWGYLKYFHSEVAAGKQDWDAILLQNTKMILDNPQLSVNDITMALIDSAGIMAIAHSAPPVIDPSLSYNLNLSWFNDTLISNEVRAKLNFIKENFRPQENVYLNKNSLNVPLFDKDAQYYSASDPFPVAEKRILALFRYWNIINYFCPNKYLIDSDWENVLKMYIPQFLNAQDTLEYHNCMLRIAHEIDDAHAYTYSSIIAAEYGDYYLPFHIKFIENSTVITAVDSSIGDVAKGDIITAVNGVHIDTVRAEMAATSPGSNSASLQRYINSDFIRGEKETLVLTLHDGVSDKTINIERNLTASTFSAISKKPEHAWEIIMRNGKQYGYINMDILQQQQVDSMFTALWHCDALIFDIRNHPNDTMWLIINYLYDGPFHIASFTKPDIAYPGTLYWQEETIGWGDFSKTWNKTVFILFDERTQSHGEYSVMAFEQHPSAIKIGHKSAGANGNVTAVYLPGKIYSYFTGSGVFYPNRSDTQRKGITADISVEQSINGIRNGVDDLLETALNYDISSVNTSTKQPHSFLYNAPNPFNPSTKIFFNILKAGSVKIDVYNTSGKKVATLWDKYTTVGNHYVVFNGQQLASGLYFYRLEQPHNVSIKKMVFIK